jgi:hypothetical protein
VERLPISSDDDAYASRLRTSALVWPLFSVIGATTSQPSAPRSFSCSSGTLLDPNSPVSTSRTRYSKAGRQSPLSAPPAKVLVADPREREMKTQLVLASRGMD